MRTPARIALCVVLLTVSVAPAWPDDKDPKQTPENTIVVTVPEPVKVQTFNPPAKFYVAAASDRSGDPQPTLVIRRRGGIWVDREPKEIVKSALEEALKTAGALSADAGSADYVMNVYIFHFGAAEGSGLEYFGKVDLNVVLKNPKTGKSVEVVALGTSLKDAGFTIRKKSIQAKVKYSMEWALHDALRNLLRGIKLRDAVAALAEPAVEPAAVVQQQ